jgi:hypothetical protein
VPPRRLISPTRTRMTSGPTCLSGELGILVGDEVDVAGPGSWALKPRNVVHAMWNAGADPAQVIEALTPAGTERWLEENCRSRRRGPAALFGARGLRAEGRARTSGAVDGFTSGGGRGGPLPAVQIARV